MSNPLRESSNKATPVLELLKGEMTMDDYLNGNQKIIRKRRQQEREQDENFEPVINNTKDEIRSKPKDSNKKPLYTYASLIGQAILQAPNRRLPLNEIYEWIMTTYPFYKKENKGWQNSIRHNLTLCPAFRKVERESGHHAKGSYWTIPDEFMCCFVNGAYKNDKVPANNKRKKRSKTGDNIMSNDQPVAGDNIMSNDQPVASDIDDFINDFSFTDTLPTSNKTFQEFEHYQTNFDNVNDPDGPSPTKSPLGKPERVGFILRSGSVAPRSVHIFFKCPTFDQNLSSTRIKLFTNGHVYKCAFLQG
ncbi:hypothetical protein C2G38_2027774 [Gigaspora rosea]|uniref:Fork-head domain-containing protein n=1 Tax=Gigaspora rosea TaxID=44941 RepID=A0A397W503_9GLOM|nr:hypothetical protein C2G38_2027774 [Gigaspora rosea]